MINIIIITIITIMFLVFSPSLWWMTQWKTACCLSELPFAVIIIIIIINIFIIIITMILASASTLKTVDINIVFLKLLREGTMDAIAYY